MNTEDCKHEHLMESSMLGYGVCSWCGLWLNIATWKASNNLVKPAVKCECGGEKTAGTHSSWCPKSPR